MIQKIFTDIFNADPIVVRSPLPMRLMGEYNLYNDGWLLTTTLSKFVEVAVSKREDAGIELFSVQHLEKIALSPSDLIHIPKASWAKALFAVIYQLHLAGHNPQGLNIMIDTSQLEEGIPFDAALESALYIAINELFNLRLSSRALLAIGTDPFDPDFYSCLFGKKGYALKLDARNQSHDYIPLRMEDYSPVLCIMGNRACIPANIYRNRYCACEDVLFQLKKVDGTIKSVRDVELPLLFSHITNTEIRRRAAFIIRENTRVIAASTNLQAGNLKAFGQKLSESDDGLMAEYEIGSTEADWLVDELGWSEQVVGARRLTVPYRNAAIAFVRTSRLEETNFNLAKAFEKQFGKKLNMYPVLTAHGAERVQLNDRINEEYDNRLR